VAENPAGEPFEVAFISGAGRRVTPSSPKASRVPREPRSTAPPGGQTWRPRREALPPSRLTANHRAWPASTMTPLRRRTTWRKGRAGRSRQVARWRRHPPTGRRVPAVRARAVIGDQAAGFHRASRRKACGWPTTSSPVCRPEHGARSPAIYNVPAGPTVIRFRKQSSSMIRRVVQVRPPSAVARTGRRPDDKSGLGIEKTDIEKRCLQVQSLVLFAHVSPRLRVKNDRIVTHGHPCCSSGKLTPVSVARVGEDRLPCTAAVSRTDDVTARPTATIVRPNVWRRAEACGGDVAAGRGNRQRRNPKADQQARHAERYRCQL